MAWSWQEGEQPTAAAATAASLGEDAGKLTPEDFKALPSWAQEALRNAAKDTAWRQEFNQSLERRKLTDRHNEQRAQHDAWYQGEVAKIESQAREEADSLGYFKAKMLDLDARNLKWNREFDASADRALAKLDEVDERPNLARRLQQEHGLIAEDTEGTAPHPPRRLARRGRQAGPLPRSHHRAGERHAGPRRPASRGTLRR